MQVSDFIDFRPPSPLLYTGNRGCPSSILDRSTVPVRYAAMRWQTTYILSCRHDSPRQSYSQTIVFFCTYVVMMRRRAALAAFIGLVVCVLYGIAVAKSAESRDNCNQLEIARFNRATILPRLRRLVKATTFFRYYRFRLCDDCVHDFPSPICGSPECACIECSEEDIPCDKSGKCYLRDIVQDDDCLSRGSQAANAQLNFDLFDDKDEHSTFSPWPREKRMNGSWLTRPQENGVDTYVDLTKNPERWTGYGPQQYSSDIWRAIYDENCFESSGSNEGNDMCEEETTFKKIISGFHASVSTHIASEFCEEVDPDSSRCLRFSSSADRCVSVRSVRVSFISAMVRKASRRDLSETSSPLASHGCENIRRPRYL